MTVTESQSLYERIGGAAAVDAAVDRFYEKVMGDPMLKPFFDGVDMNRQRAKQKAFMTYAFGGASRYDGKTMRAAHAHLVEKGLGDAHFNAVAGHLQATLNDLNVPEDLAAQVMSIVGSTRDDVLNR